MRALLMPLLLLSALACMAQSETGNAIGYSKAVNVPLNAVLLYDRSLEAWEWTFGGEPGARVALSDRRNGVIEGTARVNFRSAGLALREETMGVVQYRVVIQVKAGECRISVTELTHTGNRNTPRGGIHLGLLAKGDTPVRRVRGAAAGNIRKAYAEVKAVSEARILALLQAFEARLRANAEP
ncbi:MAG: DUF4468 domain-containing protein [Flavobacteriales bacterium]|nr:DUF4468 domain-containing protein [Flavobacteriales bacterium]